MFDWLGDALKYMFSAAGQMQLSYSGHSTSVLYLFAALSIVLVILRLFLPRG